MFISVVYLLYYCNIDISIFFIFSARERLDNDLLELQSVVTTNKTTFQTPEDGNASLESKSLVI